MNWSCPAVINATEISLTPRHDRRFSDSIGNALKYPCFVDRNDRCRYRVMRRRRIDITGDTGTNPTFRRLFPACFSDGLLRREDV